MSEDKQFTPLEPDGSESRFNEVLKPKVAGQVDQQPVFESWHDPQPELVSSQPQVEIHPLISPDSSVPDQILKKRKPGFWLLLISALLILFFFFSPFRVTTLVLGIDRPPKGTWTGRSDTLILTTIPPILPKVSMLSIPRDLWVTIPNHYENRINTAHYFAELEVADTGMKAAKETVEINFGINVNYVVRIKFDGFIDVVDAFGGVTVDLPTDMSGLTAGKHHLNGKDALKFVRDRTGSDDFFRQQRGQLFITAAIKQVLNPITWPRFPAIVIAVTQAIETDLPVWLWPRVAYGLAFSALRGFDTHTFDRNAVTPWVTNEGAQVLLPNWELMNPLIDGMFK